VRWDKGVIEPAYIHFSMEMGIRTMIFGQDLRFYMILVMIMRLQ
jgi:hypothetical protein